MLFFPLMKLINKAKFALFFYIILCSIANATLHVVVKDVAARKINLAIKSDNQKVTRIIADDLNLTNKFDCRETADSASKADYILNIGSGDANNLKIDFKLLEVIGGKILLQKTYCAPIAYYRALAHKISNDIYEYLIGEKACFDSKIIFVDERGMSTNIVKRLAIMDLDGNNLHYLTSGAQIVVTPKASPKGQQITYTGYLNDVPSTYVQDLKTGARRIVGRFKNGTIGPSFSSDGRSLLFSILKENGNSNIFCTALYDAAWHENISQSLKRLTYVDAIDCSVSSSPDGKFIVFSSDRSGKQQLYILNLLNLKIRKLSHGEGSYSTPVWSPDGSYIAFTKKLKKVFSIGVIRPDGSDEKILTVGFHSERPSWAPNSRQLVYFREDSPAKRKLYIIDIFTKKERKILTPNGASDPEWIK